ncbi:hypothetical protein [Ancylobacter rudongensis]|uniref:Uncharacterized protein n=1 Tax=Ancylobacter rudongensis TaxID=177413 RepID=A0A1G4UP88_9HYPH|nr:hypothetical protein [Ancylobacter rudongensis]SCW95463.1 hypothetical protein SAMN05660859_0034 [Ancylobacter rudongensis]
MTDSPLKGALNGNCNLSACQRPGAAYFNTSTRAYYCRSCAESINGWAKRDAGFFICFLTQGAEADQRLKYGPEAERQLLATESQP